MGFASCKSARILESFELTWTIWLRPGVHLKDRDLAPDVSDAVEGVLYRVLRKDVAEGHFCPLGVCQACYAISLTSYSHCNQIKSPTTETWFS